MSSGIGMTPSYACEQDASKLSKKIDDFFVRNVDGELARNSS